MGSTHAKFRRQRRKSHCPLTTSVGWAIGISLQQPENWSKVFWESPTVGRSAIVSNFLRLFTPRFLERCLPDFHSSSLFHCIKSQFWLLKATSSQNAWNDLNYPENTLTTHCLSKKKKKMYKCYMDISKMANVVQHSGNFGNKENKQANLLPWLVGRFQCGLDLHPSQSWAGCGLD